MKHFFSAGTAILILTGLLRLAAQLSAQTSLQVGYSAYTADSGASFPVGAALFRVNDSTGVVVSEAGVGAAEPILKGRIFVDEVGTKMGLALVNANSNAASITFVLRDLAGTELARRSHSLGANQHLASYVDDLFAAQATGLQGSLTFESSQPLAAVTLRENRNSRNEPLYTTLPVVNLSAAPSRESVVFPHIAVGGGFTTELLLMNPTSNPMSGKVDLYGSDGQPLVLQSGDQTISTVPYAIAANGTFQAVLTSTTSISGWATAVPSADDPAPSGSVIFQFNPNNQVVTEAGVAATPAIKAARVFVDNAQTQTGVAIVNPSGRTATLTLTLMDRDGTVEDTQTRMLAAGNHLALYVNEVFSTVSAGFTGLMDIRSDVDVASVTLKLTVNARGDLVMTTLPVADLTSPPSATTRIFPQIAIGGGFSTRFILISTDSSRSASGKLSFYQSDGSNMVLPIGQQTGSQFPYQLSAGGGRQFYPGNSARVEAIQVIDPSDGQVTTEIAINEGNTVRPRLRISDSTGTYRDDFDVTIRSLDTSVATVDSRGSIKGQHAGFSTLIVTAQNVVATATATVATINSGRNGFQIEGIAQDLANRLYLAASSEQAILLAQDIQQQPATYAGIPNNAGLKNGGRLEAQFHNPSFLAFDQAGGKLYVTDAANNVIRRVDPGNPGTVTTLAGTGVPGTQNGPLAQAGFNNPQGIALDGRGNLWIADTGNHTIRRIKLQNGIVETIAGMPGTSGLVDGLGPNARFNGPLGLAIENETTAQEVERLRLGLPPPPLRILVADSGNNVIRRVTEDGQVETLVAANTTMNPARSKPIIQKATLAARPLLFTAPTAAAADSNGNIFVTEKTTGQVKTILTTGSIVAVVQRRTFASPSGIVITNQGKVVIADGKTSAREITFGEPAISSVDPGRVSNRGGSMITIKGRNFAPDSIVIIAGLQIQTAKVQNSTSISVAVPPLPSGLTTVTVQNRGGLTQTSLMVDPVPLSELLPGQITTVAGGTTFSGEGKNALTASLFLPRATAVDRMGNVLIADTYNYRIRRVDARTNEILTIAGTGQFGFSGDFGPASAARVSLVSSVAVNSQGDIYFADSESHRIRKIDATTGIISTVAGDGRAGYYGDGGPATSAALNYPWHIALDKVGNLFIADSNNYCVRKVDVNGVITTVAGNGKRGFNVPGGQPSGDGGQATVASLGTVTGVAVDDRGNLLIADPDNNRVRKVDFATNSITTIAGNGRSELSGDSYSAVDAGLSGPFAVAIDSDGVTYIADRGNHCIRKVDLAGKIKTIAGGLSGPEGVNVDSAGNVYVADPWAYRIRKISTRTGIMTTVAGNGQAGYDSDNGPATAAALNLPRNIVFDATENLYINDQARDRIIRVDKKTDKVTTLAVGFGIPQGLAFDFSTSNLYVGSLSTGVFRVNIVTAEKVPIWGGVTSPAGIAIAPNGDVFISDSGNHRIRKVDKNGMITTIAGTGLAGGRGDGGLAYVATLNSPQGLAFDGPDRLYFADSGNNRVRSIDLTKGIIATVAGTGEFNFSGDGNSAKAATLRGPADVCVDKSGNIYVADSQNFRVRKIDHQTGIITTVAGGGTLGDNVPADRAALYPTAVTVDANDNLFIADYGNNRIRAVRRKVQE